MSETIPEGIKVSGGIPYGASGNISYAKTPKFSKATPGKKKAVTGNPHRESYKDKFNAQMKKAGIDSLDDLKTDAEKKAFFKAVDKSHDAVNEELLAIAEETINEFKLKDSDIEKLKKGVKEMPPLKGAKLGKPEKVKAADEDLEEEMKDLEPDEKEINAMVKDPHKSKEGEPKDDILAQYDDSKVKADVKKKGGDDMAKVKDAPEMMTAMKKINAMYKTEKYHDTKPGSINDTVMQMHESENKDVTIRVKEFSKMVETYLLKGGVIDTTSVDEDFDLDEEINALPLKEVRAFIDTYNRHFLTNYRAEEFIIRDRLNEEPSSGAVLKPAKKPSTFLKFAKKVAKFIEPAKNFVQGKGYQFDK